MHPARSFLVFYFLLCVGTVSVRAQPVSNRFYLIAHRGGVVDSATPENSMASLQKAYAQGFRGVEIDLRVTSDGQLVTNHDASLKRYYGVDRKIHDMTWNEIAQLKGKNGNHVLRFEEVAKYCEGKLQLMIDNKIDGLDTALFNRLLLLLKKYQLGVEALMIGTDESTAFFTGKIRLSCTRQQLEANMKTPAFRPEHYFLFSNAISREDVLWARQQRILVVAAVNAWMYKKNNKDEEAKKAIDELTAAGVDHFQVDSEFTGLFQQSR